MIGAAAGAMGAGLASGLGHLGGVFDSELYRRDPEYEGSVSRQALGEYLRNALIASMVSPGIDYRYLTGANAPRGTGALDTYETLLNRLVPAQARAEGQYEDLALSQFLRNVPAYQQAQQAANPQYYGGLMEALGGARSDYAAGDRLSPTERRTLTQNVRGAQSARGMGYGMGAAGEEALALSQAGSALRQQRYQNLLQALGLARSTVRLPQFSAPGGSMSLGASLLGLGTNTANQYASPNQPYIMDLLGSNANAKWWEQIQRANNKEQGDRSLMSAFGAGGGMFGG